MIEQKVIYGFYTIPGHSGVHIWNNDWCMAVVYLDESDKELWKKLEDNAAGKTHEGARAFFGLTKDEAGKSFFPIGTFTPDLDYDNEPDWNAVKKWARKTYASFGLEGEIEYEKKSLEGYEERQMLSDAQDMMPMP
jgi:hypothetical protein